MDKSLVIILSTFFKPSNSFFKLNSSPWVNNLKVSLVFDFGKINSNSFLPSSIGLADKGLSFILDKSTVIF